jgi:hypothetical protein
MAGVLVMPMSVEEFIEKRRLLHVVDGDVASTNALAALMYKSGLSNADLAAYAGNKPMSASWVNFKLNIGEFLVEHSSLIEDQSRLQVLNERRFRHFWKMTDANNASRIQRFRAVADIINSDLYLMEGRCNDKKPPVNPAELFVKLTPIVNALLEEGNKTVVTVSLPTVLRHAHNLKKLLDAWTK